MNKSMKISGLMWALLLAWGSASAAGLGKLTVQSALGQPLRAEIELLSVGKDDLASLEARLASAEAYRQARMDRSGALGNLNFSVEQNRGGKPVIRLSSATAITEPFLDVLIELNWSSGRMVREYTLLLDPPAEFRQAEPARAVAVPELARSEGAAPESAPRRADATRARTTGAPATPKIYGPIRSGETLRGIAAKLKPAEVSLEQMMVALYQNNPGVFQGNNMNRMASGRALAVPETDLVAANTQAEALRVIRGHAAEWHAYRGQVAGMAAEAAPARPDDVASAGRIEKRVEQTPAAAPSSRDVLKLSKGEPAGTPGKPDGKTLEKLQMMEEELAAKARALQEAQDRVSQLERTVSDMQSLLDMKAREAAEAAAAPAVEPETPPAPPPATEQPAPATPVAPVATDLPPPIEDNSSSWLSTFISNPIYIGGLIAAVLLSVLLWLMMMGNRRRQGLTKFEDSIMTGGEFKNNAVFTPPPSTGAAAGVSTEGSMLLTDFSRLGMGAIDSHEVDPIAEAEVYMAYGRDAQAEEILKEALAKDPNRHEIALKLLEIYAARKDTTVFETTASELYAGLGGQNTPIWSRAAEMGRSIDPDNPLYRAQEEASAAPVAAGIVAAAAAAAATAAASEPEPLAFESAPVEPEPAPTEEAAMLEAESGQGLEFDQAPEPEPVAIEMTEPEPTMVDDDSILEFDADTLFTATEPEAGPAPAREPEETGASLPTFDVTEAGETEATPVVEEAAGGLDLPDLDFPADTAGSTPPRLDLDGIDLELREEIGETAEPVGEVMEEATDFDMTAFTETSPEMPVEAPAETEIPSDALETAFEFDAAPVEIEAMPVEESVEVAAPAEAPMEEIEAPVLDQSMREEVNTKLDLARAYLEMGDREGAREILQEVVDEGDADQKAEADKLMAEVG